MPRRTGDGERSAVVLGGTAQRVPDGERHDHERHECKHSGALKLQQQFPVRDQQQQCGQCEDQARALHQHVGRPLEERRIQRAQRHAGDQRRQERLADHNCHRAGSEFDVTIEIPGRQRSLHARRERQESCECNCRERHHHIHRQH